MFVDRFKSNWKEILLLIAILLIAAFFRVYQLEQLPPGLHYDEAFKAVMADRVIAGTERPIFFRENQTEEPMAVYAAALSFALVGATPWSLRLVSALAGILGVATLYALARALFPSRATATFAALVLAILYWHVNFSRLGMENIYAPLMMTLCILFLWRALKSGEWRAAGGEGNSSSHVTRHTSYVLAGIFLAATQYTYKGALVFPFFVAGFLVIEIVADKTFLARHRRGLMVFAFAAFLGFAPLGLYFATNPGEFLERPSAVSIASAGAAPLIENVVKVGGMFFVRGDANPRSNLPDRPALDPFLALGFVVGLVAVAKNFQRSDSRLILLWFVAQLSPSILTDFAPHFGRSIGAVPALALIAAVGFGAILQKAGGTQQKSVWLMPTVYGLLLAGLFFSAFSTFRDYFDVWATRTGNFDSFDVGVLQLGQKLRERPTNERVYVSPLSAEHYTLRFGLGGRDATSFDGRRALVLSNAPATYGIVTREDTRTLTRLGAVYPRGAILERTFDFTAQRYAAIFRADGSPPQIAPQFDLRAKLGNEIELLGYDLRRDGDALALTVYWRSLTETRGDYTVFAHLIGGINPATQSPLWAQDDARPGHDSVPTPRWRAGEIVIDDYRLVMPANLPRGEYNIELGMYVLETGARVRVINANGARMENDRVLTVRLSLP